MAILTHIKENEQENVICEHIGWRKRYWIRTTESLFKFIPNYEDIYWELRRYPIQNNRVELTGVKKRFKNANKS